MDRRSFFKRLGAVTISLPLFKLVKVSAEEEKKLGTVLPSVPTDGGLFTKEELQKAGFIVVDKPCFMHEGNSYSLTTYKVGTWNAELEQDLIMQGVSPEVELKAAILNNLKELVEKQNAKLKFIMNVYKHRFITPEDFTPRFCAVVRMALG